MSLTTTTAASSMWQRYKNNPALRAVYKFNRQRECHLEYIYNTDYLPLITMANNSEDEFKPSVTWQEKLDVSPPLSGIDRDAEAFDDVEEKKLIRKIDWRLLPILGALYSISLVSDIVI